MFAIFKRLNYMRFVTYLNSLTYEKENTHLIQTKFCFQFGGAEYFICKIYITLKHKDQPKYERKKVVF